MDGEVSVDARLVASVVFHIFAVQWE